MVVPLVATREDAVFFEDLCDPFDLICCNGDLPSRRKSLFDLFDDARNSAGENRRFEEGADRLNQLVRDTLGKTKSDPKPSVQMGTSTGPICKRPRQSRWEFAVLLETSAKLLRIALEVKSRTDHRGWLVKDDEQILRRVVEERGGPRHEIWSK